MPARPADPGHSTVAQRSTAPATQTFARSAGRTAAAALGTGLATLEPAGDVVFAVPPNHSAPSVQRADEPSAWPAPAPTPTTTTVPSADQPSPTTPTAPTNDQLDELAKDLYAKIRDQLKAELRLDRERCGRLTDVR